MSCTCAMTGIKTQFGIKIYQNKHYFTRILGGYEGKLYMIYSHIDLKHYQTRRCTSWPRTIG